VVFHAVFLSPRDEKTRFGQKYLTLRTVGRRTSAKPVNGQSTRRMGSVFPNLPSAKIIDSEIL
jgi:hypothetical protein